MDEQELEEICITLDAYQHERQISEDEKISEEGNLRSNVENRLGYSTLLEEEERERLCKLRDVIIKAARNGDDPPEGDGCEDAYRYACNTIANIESWEQRGRNVKKKQEALVVKLPVWKWCDNVKGLSPNLAAKLLGSIPPNDNYEGHCLGQFGHKRQLFKFFRHGVKERDEKDKRDLKASGQREKELWNVGKSLIKQADYYYDIFFDRKMYETHRDMDSGLIVLGPAKTKEAWLEKGLPEIKDKDDLPEEMRSETYKDLYECDGIVSANHINKRAARYMRKQFLADILEAWKRLT